MAEGSSITNVFEDLSCVIPDSKIFGPYELLNFTLLDPYKDFIPTSPSSSSSGVSKGAVAGIVIGAVVGAVLLSAFVSLYILRLQRKKYHAVSNRRHGELTVYLW